MCVSVFITPFVARAEHVRFWKKVEKSRHVEIETVHGESSAMAKRLMLPSLIQRAFPDIAASYFDSVRSIYIEVRNDDLQAGIANHFAGCGNLVHLHWPGEVSNRMARDIRRCRNLSFLKLKDCPDTTALTENIQGLEHLEVISFNRCEISEGGIDNLMQMNQLKLILFHETVISDSAIMELRKKLPNCYVFAFFEADLKD